MTDEKLGKLIGKKSLPSTCPDRLTSWEQEVELEAVRSWVPLHGADKPNLDPEACDKALECVRRLLKGEAADVDGCPDIFITDPMVPESAAGPVVSAPAPPLTQAAEAQEEDGEAQPRAAKRLRGEAPLSPADFSGKVKMAQNILLYLLKSTASRVTVRVILDVTKLKQFGQQEELESMARKIFRLTRDAGLASLGVQGGSWTGLRPPEQQIPEVMKLVEAACGSISGVESALRKRNEFHNFNMEKCTAAFDMLRGEGA